MGRIDIRIGTPNRRPDVTLSGASYTLPATTRGLSHPGYYVVLDVFPPRDFNVEAAIVELETQLAPPSLPTRSKDKPNAET